jgi:hypothetical protein
MYITLEIIAGILLEFLGGVNSFVKLSMAAFCGRPDRFAKPVWSVPHDSLLYSVPLTFHRSQIKAPARCKKAIYRRANFSKRVKIRRYHLILLMKHSTK